MKRSKRTGGLSAGRTTFTLTIAAAMLLSGMAILSPTDNNAEAATVEPGDDWAQERLQFAYRPDNHAPTATADHVDNGGIPEYPDQLGIYFNWLEALSGDDTLSVRLYGENGQGAPDLWETREDAFRPESIATDSATFNPAMIIHTDSDFTRDGNGDLSWMRGCDEEDSNLKKHLRTWYEPNHEFNGPRAEAGFFNPPTRADVIQVETTYYLVSANDYQPYPICAGDARFPFPTDGSGGALAALGAGAFPDDTTAWPQPGLDTMREVRTTLVEAGPTDSEGTVRLERQGETLNSGDAIQMFDHVYRYEGIEEDFSGNMRAKFTVWYAGNTNLDSRTTVLLGGAAGTQKFLSRANNLFNDVAHPEDNPTQPRTSFINVKSFTDDTVTFDLGKEIRGGDIFYVDGVRYEFPSVFVTHDANRAEDVLHQLTVRTPFPKSDPAHNECPDQEAWSSVPNEQLEDLNREACLHGQWQVQDWSVVSTQRIIQVNHEEPLPVNPPFNHEFYRQVDDTQVVLWEPGPAQDREDECATEAKFPWGERNDDVPDGDGMPFFRLGHTYVTQTSPPQEWLDCWAAESTGFGDIAERVDESEAAIDEPGLNFNAWDFGDSLPVLPDPGLTNFYWHKEWCDDRFSTNLQEILKENGLPEYTSYEIDSRPCTFTEFVLPDRNNPHSSIGLDANSGILDGGVELDSGKNDLTTPNAEKRLNFGDYLVMTSFFLQDGETRLAFAHKPDAASLVNDLDASNDFGLRGDLYVQTTLPEGGFENTTLRLYGASGEGPIDYTEYWHAFDPYAIGKDSATFNPAIILHEDDDFTGHDQTFGWLKSCDESNSNLKKTMRMWYEPGHTYDGPRVESGATQDPTVADAITFESSYKLVDSDSYVPRTMCEGGRVPFPVEGYTAYQHPNGTYVVEGNPQPGLNTMRSVKIGDVSGTGTDGVVELIRENVNLGIGEAIQMFDHLFVYQGVEEDFANPDQMKAKFRIYYLGNPAADSAQDQLIDGDQRHYVSRGNNLHDEASHGWNPDPLPIRTTFIDLTQGTFNDTHVTFNVGKELAKDDTFYVTGVRYDIPAVYVKEDPLAGDELGVQYLTMRTSLPKSDPNRGNETGANYTTVPNDQMEGSPSRETYDNPGKEWVVRDESVVSTQRIREFTYEDPLPLNPPFNGVTGEDGSFYRMVDDTDILLWEPGNDPESDCYAPWLLDNGFPWGPRNDGVSDGNGLPLFPLGHTYLTMAEPPQDWIDCFDAEPTEYEQLSKRVRENEAPSEPGINHNAWAFNGGGGQDEFPVQVVAENTSLFWVSEWCEGRFSTNLLQLVDNAGAYGALQVDSEPCEYTEFVLPDRSNPLSELEAQLETLKDDGVPAGFYKLLGGDYLVTSSFRLQGGDGPENWVNWYDGAGDQTAPGHPSGDADCVIQMADLMVAVNDWFNDVIPLFDSDASTPQLSRVVSDWQASSADNPHIHYPGCSHA